MNYECIFGEAVRGELTDIAYEKLCYGDVFDLEEFSIEELRSAVDWEDCPVFIDGVVERLNQLGDTCDASDTKKILNIVQNRYKKYLGEDCPRTVQDWIRGTPPSTTKRENNYKFCYALEMNIEEVAVFFRKYFLTIPFNLKDRIDAVFFYGLSQNRPYGVIKQLLDLSSSFETVKSGEEYTRELKNVILECMDDKDFFQYLKSHCYGKEQQYQAARNKIIEIIDKYNKSNYAELHLNIMGFNYQDARLCHMVRQAELPTEFTKSLPTNATFADIKKRKAETYDTLRKTLVILLFYDYYLEAYKKIENFDDYQIEELFWEFHDEIDRKLIECGLIPLYVRNPFDKLILFCAASTYPIGTFHGLNDLRYSEE